MAQEQVLEFLIQTNSTTQSKECKTLQIQQMIESNVVHDNDLKRIIQAKMLSCDDITIVKRQIKQDKEAQFAYIKESRTRLNRARMIFITG